MTKIIHRALLLFVLLAIGVLPLLCCGCTIRLKVEKQPAGEVESAREVMTEILAEEEIEPVPDERFTEPAVPDPPAEPQTPDPVPEPLEPLRATPPAGWPEGVIVQKFTSENCSPCHRWDREERQKLSAVMLDDITAWDKSGTPSPEALAANVTRVPYFQLKRGETVLWQGRGYFTADLLIERAKEFGGKIQ